MSKQCPKCGEDKPLTEEYYYPARPRVGHKKLGWQSFCKMCWKAINRANKDARNLRKRMAVLSVPVK